MSLALDRQHFARVGAVAALTGAPTLFIATLLHPMSADPSDAPAAFAEYAADSIWVASHLGQFLGFAAVGVAAAAGLQAVDGVALKVMVDRWARATGEARARAFEGGFAVRQVEVGMASLLSLLFALTVTAFGLAMLRSRRFPAWLGCAGLLGGLGTIAAGIAQAYTGFSPLAMALSMPASSVLLLWAMVVGAWLWRLAPTLTSAGRVEHHMAHRVALPRTSRRGNGHAIRPRVRSRPSFPIGAHTGPSAGSGPPVIGAGGRHRRSSPGGGARARPVFSPEGRR